MSLHQAILPYPHFDEEAWLRDWRFRYSFALIFGKLSHLHQYGIATLAVQNFENHALEFQLLKIVLKPHPMPCNLARSNNPSHSLHGCDVLNFNGITPYAVALSLLDTMMVEPLETVEFISTFSTSSLSRPGFHLTEPVNFFCIWTMVLSRSSRRKGVVQLCLWIRAATFDYLQIRV